MKEIRITPTPHFAGFGYELRIFNHDKNNPDNDWVAKEIIMEAITEKNQHLAWGPLVQITKEEAQLWLDELWALGIRPTDGDGSIGAIGAIKYHLEDMRKLVFKPEGPKV